MFLPLVLAATFAPSVLVDRTDGSAPLTVTIDMCASAGRNLRFGWDYDGDGIDDQRGPCRRAVTREAPGLHRVRVSVWEAVSADPGREDRTIWINASCDGDGTFRPDVWLNTPVSYAGGGVAAEFVFDACASQGEGLEFSWDWGGPGGACEPSSPIPCCRAKLYVDQPGVRNVRLAIRESGCARRTHVEALHLTILPDPPPRSGGRCMSTASCPSGLTCSTERGACRPCSAPAGAACPAACFGECE